MLSFLDYFFQKFEMCKGLSSPILRYFELQIDFDTLLTGGARNRTPHMWLLIHFATKLQKKRHRFWTTFPRNSKCVHETKYNPNITLSYSIDKSLSVLELLALIIIWKNLNPARFSQRLKDINLSL